MIFNIENGVKAMLICFVFPVAYSVGFLVAVNLPWNESGNNSETAQKRIYGLLVSISLGAFAHYMLNFAINIGSSVGRNTNDIWSGEILSATGQSTLVCMTLGLSVAMLLAPRKKYIKYIGILSLAGIFAYNLILAGRTLIVVFLLIFLLGFFYTFTNAKKESKRLRILGWVVFLVTCAVIIWVYDIGGIRETFKHSNLFLRFTGEYADDIEETGRFEVKLNFLKDMLNYPFGGKCLREKYNGYAHDFLLDGYDMYGVFGFMALLAILISSIKNLFVFCKNKENDLSIRAAFLCTYSAVFLIFFIEPAIEIHWLIVCYSIVNGTVAGYNSIFCGKNALGKKGVPSI